MDETGNFLPEQNSDWTKQEDFSLKKGDWEDERKLRNSTKTNLKAYTSFHTFKWEKMRNKLNDLQYWIHYYTHYCVHNNNLLPGIL